MHDTEKTFLHFPGVHGAEDDHFPPSKIKIYASGGCHVVCVTITRELASIVYSEVRSTEILQLFRSGSDAPATHPVIQLYTKLIHMFAPPIFLDWFLHLGMTILRKKIMSTLRGLIWRPYPMEGIQKHTLLKKQWIQPSFINSYVLLTCCAWTVSDKPWQRRSSLWFCFLDPSSRIDRSQRPVNQKFNTISVPEMKFTMIDIYIYDIYIYVYATEWQTFSKYI